MRPYLIVITNPLVHISPYFVDARVQLLPERLRVGLVPDRLVGPLLRLARLLYSGQLYDCFVYSTVSVPFSRHKEIYELLFAVYAEDCLYRL